MADLADEYDGRVAAALVDQAAAAKRSQTAFKEAGLSPRWRRGVLRRRHHRRPLVWPPLVVTLRRVGVGVLGIAHLDPSRIDELAALCVDGDAGES